MKNLSVRFLRLFILGLAFIIFVAGASYIVITGRPVAKLDPKVVQNHNTNSKPAINNNSGSVLSFSLADVSQHNTQQDCWTVINGSVYDLTSFVSRHPGGARNILQLCGIDGSNFFNEQHGDSRKAQSTLILLKIGTLL